MGHKRAQVDEITLTLTDANERGDEERPRDREKGKSEKWKSNRLEAEKEDCIAKSARPYMI